MMHDIDNEGNRKILYIFGPPSLFPMVSFIGNDVQSSWFYTSLTDVTAYMISYDTFKEKLQESDGYHVYNGLLKQSLKEVHELLLHITDHVKTDSIEKITSILLFLLEHHTRSTSRAWRLVNFPVSHQLLADMTGLTRETVTLTMKELIKKKFARYPVKGRLELNQTNLVKAGHS